MSRRSATPPPPASPEQRLLAIPDRQPRPEAIILPASGRPVRACRYSDPLVRIARTAGITLARKKELEQRVQREEKLRKIEERRARPSRKKAISNKLAKRSASKQAKARRKVTGSPAPSHKRRRPHLSEQPTPSQSASSAGASSPSASPPVAGRKRKASASRKRVSAPSPVPSARRRAASRSPARKKAKVAAAPSPPPAARPLSVHSLPAPSASTHEGVTHDGLRLILPQHVLITKPVGRLCAKASLIDAWRKGPPYAGTVNAIVADLETQFLERFFPSEALLGETPKGFDAKLFRDYAAGTLVLHNSTDNLLRGGRRIVVPPEISPRGYLWWRLGLRKGSRVRL
jgi:hypothetical protein